MEDTSPGLFQARGQSVAPGVAPGRHDDSAGELPRAHGQCPRLPPVAASPGRPHRLSAAPLPLVRHTEKYGGALQEQATLRSGRIGLAQRDRGCVQERSRERARKPRHLLAPHRVRPRRLPLRLVAGDVQEMLRMARSTETVSLERSHPTKDTTSSATIASACGTCEARVALAASTRSNTCSRSKSSTPGRSAMAGSKFPGWARSRK